MSSITIRRLDPKGGDITRRWDRGKKEEVEGARADFEHYVKELKYFAYKIVGKKKEQIHFFDPNIEEMVLIPQTVGG